MLYKFYHDGRKKVVNLTDLYEGQSCFLIGGAPSLNNEPLELIQRSVPGVITVGLNNVCTKIKTDLWVSGDRPECFDKSILYDPSILKFANYGKRERTLDGIPWKYFANTLFYSCKENTTVQDFFKYTGQIAWWKNTWFVAIQLLYFLGFRRIYTIGTDFLIDNDNQYAWETNLSEDSIKVNTKLYSQIIGTMKELKPYMDLYGLELINCSENSRLVEDFGYLPLEIAVDEVTRILPDKSDTTTLPHSLDEKRTGTSNSK